jgi:hypothetical protein
MSRTPEFEVQSEELLDRLEVGTEFSIIHSMKRAGQDLINKYFIQYVLVYAQESDLDSRGKL